MHGQSDRALTGIVLIKVLISTGRHQQGLNRLATTVQARTRRFIALVPDAAGLTSENGESDEYEREANGRNGIEKEEGHFWGQTDPLSAQVDHDTVIHRKYNGKR
jgi:hypothetical protein